jgi:hypothetical protein
MIYVTNDPNYDSESEKQNADVSVERVGDITQEYIADGKSITISDENARNTSQCIEESLQDGKRYNNTYEIEKALGLVIERNNTNKVGNEDRRSSKEG